MIEDAPVAVPDPDPPGLTELLAWLSTRVPNIQRAKMAQDVVRRIEEEVRDPALRSAWEQRKEGATVKHLSIATGITRGRILWAINHHPRSDV